MWAQTAAWLRRNARFWGLTLAAITIVISTTDRVLAQNKSVPRIDYFIEFQEFYDGDYRDAMKAFRRVGRSGVRNANARWIDSICYYTMIGECQYHMGNYSEALAQYDSALRLSILHWDWMRRIQFPTTLRPRQPASRNLVNWGTSARGTRPANIPDIMGSMQGYITPIQIDGQNTAIDTRWIYPVQVKEIVRCTALALRRRHELMGPVGAYDDLNTRLIANFSRQTAHPNHWSQAWSDVELGLAYACAGRYGEATQRLTRGLTIGGKLDHSLTAVALLELGKIALASQQHEAAANYFLEASFAAATFDPDQIEADVIEEALRGGFVNHLVTGKKGIYPPLLRSPVWARSERLRQLQSSLLLMVGENYAAQGDTITAKMRTLDAQALILRHDMKLGNIATRLQYQKALLNFQDGNAKEGSAALAPALAHLRKSSRRQFQIELADRLYVRGPNSFTPRAADQMFSVLLREPTAADWTFNPMETLAFTLASNSKPFGHWFESALEQRAYERAVEISEQIRRRRFYASLPLGGRLLSLRWILHAPDESLSKQAILDRQSLLLAFPPYEKLRDRSEKITRSIRELPIVAENADQIRRREQLFGDLAKVSQTQETFLKGIALQRQPSDLAFPPRRSMPEIQAGMEPGTIAIIFFDLGKKTYVFVLKNDDYGHWVINSPRTINRKIASLLRSIGNIGSTHAISTEQLADPQWKKAAQGLLKDLTKNNTDSFWRDYKQLIIVPDGLVWYVPFEALQIDVGGRSRPLIESTRVRYVPFASMIVPDRMGQRRDGRLAAVAGKFFPSDDAELASKTLAQWNEVMPENVSLGRSLSAPSSLSAVGWDRLLVLDDLIIQTRRPYELSPAVLDSGKSSGQLAAWLTLPWDSPDQLVLPGFRTPAEDPFKGGADGSEMFLTVSGLMASGARSVLMSRWRVGGETGYELMREYLQELPHSDAASAWQRSVLLTMEHPLNPDREPRLSVSPKTPLDAGDGAGHPFFWSGYMLIDAGATPEPNQQQ